MPDRRRYARTPDTLLVLATCAVSAGILTATGEVPPSVLQLAPRWLGLAWSAMFALAAAASLVGVLWRDPLHGWLLELAGRLGLTFTAAGYAVALGGQGNTGAAVPVMLVAGIAVASGWRVRQLVRRLDDFRTALQGAAR